MATPRQETGAEVEKKKTMMVMEKTRYRYLLLIVLSISPLLFCFPGSTATQVPPPTPPPTPPPPPPFNLTVEQICQNTTFPSLCISSLTPFSSEMDSPQKILTIAINATMNSTQVALAEATRLLSDPSTPSTYRSFIKGCQEAYNWAILKLQDADVYIADGYGGLVNVLDTAQEAYSDCEIQYAEMDVRARYADNYDAFVSWVPDDFLPFRLSNMVVNCKDITKVH